ncbi:EcsC family protein [Limnobacter humi]|uniref:EcsC family protein n=1 Tax=Limnobacter humi TaxID=1778671 RepID=A0ABT1WES9_9BURK|nr:EcsC family protein [Limnobacter humi]MCQ8894924.1 EcsC family protein [Limnobacter humi]
MQKTSLPQSWMAPLQTVVGLVTGGVPDSKEPGRAKRPYERSKEITQKACAKAAAVSGSLAIPVGPLGMLTVLPDLMLVWRIQAQMVVDIATAFGHQGPVTQQELMNCLFQHVAGTALREYERSIPIEHPDNTARSVLDLIDQFTRSGGRDLAVRVSKQIGQVLVQRVAKRAASRIVPLAGAAVVSAYAALDTKEVARTAVEMFSGEKLPARRSKKAYPRAEAMFNVDNARDIEPDLPD